MWRQSNDITFAAHPSGPGIITACAWEVMQLQETWNTSRLINRRHNYLCSFSCHKHFLTAIEMQCIQLPLNICHQPSNDYALGRMLQYIWHLIQPFYRDAIQPPSSDIAVHHVPRNRFQGWIGKKQNTHPWNFCGNIIVFAQSHGTVNRLHEVRQTCRTSPAKI